MTKYLLALDQAVNSSGWSLFKDKKLIDYGIYKTKGYEDQKIESVRNWLSNKLQEIRLLESDSEIRVVLEDIHQQGADIRTFKILAHLQGVLINELFRQNEYKKDLIYDIYYSSEWKSGVGVKGKDRSAQKKNAQKIVLDLFKISVPQDAADSICIGLYALREKTETLNFE